MPTPSRWMIRLSFVYLIVGILLGAAMLIHKAYPLHPAIWMLLPIHIEVTIFGWIIQLTLGTAYWMLPRYLKGSSRGSKPLIMAMVLSLNVGILLVITDALARADFSFSLLGRSFELLAVGLFVYLHWNRIVTYNRG